MNREALLTEIKKNKKAAPIAHDTPVVNIHTIFVKTFFPITLE
jgi:hypothetical protein